MYTHILMFCLMFVLKKLTIYFVTYNTTATISLGMFYQIFLMVFLSVWHFLNFNAFPGMI